MTNDFNQLLPPLERIANALERMAPPAHKTNDLAAADAFVWKAESGYLQPVRNVNRIDIDLLQDESYKSLKAVLEGGIEGRPNNVIFYATSNRRHLMARDMIENERSTAINPSEAVEEKVSLSDRFGLWLGFHNISQDVYFEIIEG